VIGRRRPEHADRQRHPEQHHDGEPAARAVVGTIAPLAVRTVRTLMAEAMVNQPASNEGDDLCRMGTA